MNCTSTLCFEIYCCPFNFTCTDIIIDDCFQIYPDDLYRQLKFKLLVIILAIFSAFVVMMILFGIYDHYESICFHLKKCKLTIINHNRELQQNDNIL
jgi:hypothetical protein